MDHKGFTLVELMVAALIAGMLLMALFPSFYGVYRRWEEEKIRTSSVRNCEQIYKLLENRLKAAEKEEIESLLDGEWEESELERLFDGENYPIEHKIRIELEEETEGFLMLTVTAMSQDNKIIYEKKGAVLALNMTLKENTDE